MSALAKVFVVFIFLLSIAFFGTTATLYKTRVDWRNAYNAHAKEALAKLQVLEDHNKEIRATLTSKETELINNKAALTGTSLKLSATVAELGIEKTEKSEYAKNAAKSAELATNTQKLLEAEKTSYKQLEEALNKSKADLDAALEQKRLADAARDSIRLDLAKTQEALHAQKVEVARLTESYETLEIANNACVKIHGGLTGQTASPVDAIIKKVDQKEKLVLISAGKDQNVRLGDEFTVHRGGNFVGKVKVIRVFPDLSGAEIILTKEGAAIEAGDKASTQI